MFVLKYIFKKPYHAFRTAESRELLTLLWKYDGVKRYEQPQDAQDRRSPLVNRQYKGNKVMDLQLNIHAYRIN